MQLSLDTVAGIKHTLYTLMIHGKNLGVIVSGSNTRSFLSRWPLSIASVLCILLGHYYLPQVGDDSYIYFRYVEQTLQGHWLQWSLHLPPVEGYSSPLWLGLLILLSSLGLPTIAAAKALGAVCGGLTFLMLWLTVKRICDSQRLADLSVLLLSLSAGFFYWTGSGLETPLYAFLWIAFTHAIMRSPQHTVSYGLVGLLLIARPEGPFLAPLLCLLMYWMGRHQQQKLNWPAALTLFVFGALALALRWHLYGLLLPNTYYAKATGDLLPQIIQGISYGKPIACCGLILALIALRLKDVQLTELVALLAIFSAFVVAGGGDWMFHYRLWQPLLPLLILTALYTWKILDRGAWISRSALLLSAAPGLFLAVHPVDVIRAGQGYQLPLEEYQEGTMTQQSFVLAEKIRHHLREQQGSEEGHSRKIIAVNHAGALPMALLEHDFIDMVGLNDAEIAATPGERHLKFNIEYVLDSEPDLVVLNTRIKPGTGGHFYHKGYWAGEDALVDHPGFQATYQPTDIMVSWQWELPLPFRLLNSVAPESWIVVYERTPLSQQTAAHDPR